MSADYLDLLLGRARGEVPAAEPRILATTAPSTAVPWGEVTEERIAVAEASSVPVNLQQHAAADRNNRTAPHEHIATSVPVSHRAEPEETTAARPTSAPTPASVQNTTRTVHETIFPPAASPRGETPTFFKRTHQAESGDNADQPEPPQVRGPNSLLPPVLATPTLRPLQAHTAVKAPQRESRTLEQAEQQPQLAPAAPPPVTIRIDRVEVRAAAAPARTLQMERKPVAVPLNEYLRGRKGATQ